MASPHSHSAMNLYGNFKKSMKIKIEANQTRKEFLLNGFKMKLMQSDMDLNPSECPTTWISQERVRNFRN